MPTVSALSLAPEQALAYFRAKIPEGSFDYRDIFGAQHATYWTVAKAMELDVLDAIGGAMDEALATGVTKESFAKGLTPTLQKLGWWGRQEREDPLTGELREVQLGSARRLATIYDTNLRTAYAAGRWERIQARKAERPWLLYQSVMDGRERPQHAAWHGTLLRVDDPWWRTHYPPCGWFCRCWVLQLSDADLERRGLAPSPQAPDLRAVNWTNPRTGVTIKLPEGIDPGFGHNVGMAADQAARQRLIEKMEAVEPAAASALVSVGLDGAAFRDFLREGANRLGDWPVGLLDPSRAEAIGAKARVLRLSRDSADKQARHHKDLGVADYRAVATLLRGGELLPSKKARHWGFLGQHDGRWYELIVKTAANGRELYLQSLHFSDQENAERILRRGWAAVEGSGGREGSVPVG